jgi:hypothetical protein
MQESMTRGVWWDTAAPYGPNGYEYGRGEDVTGHTVAREITFDMMPGDPNCIARGVAEMTDGRVYMFTVRKPGHATERDHNGRPRPRLASLSRQPFHETARGLVDWEAAGGRITPDAAAAYRDMISTL